MFYAPWTKGAGDTGSGKQREDQKKLSAGCALTEPAVTPTHMGVSPVYEAVESFQMLDSAQELIW